MTRIRKTKQEMLDLKKQAFQRYCANPAITNADLAKSYNVSPDKIKDWIESPEWREWSNRFFEANNQRLKQKILALDDKIICYIDDLISGNLEKGQIRASTAVVNVYKSRLEMAGLINKKADTINNNNYIDSREIKNVHIENMDENQLLKFITTNEVPTNIDQIEKSILEIEDKVEESEKQDGYNNSSINLEELGIKTERI